MQRKLKKNHSYIMEGDEETTRLDLKTDPETVKTMAKWAGIRPGMRIADLGCGPGKTTFYLSKLVQPKGSAVGLDISQHRIDYAKSNYKKKNVDFVTGDIRKPLDELGVFDFIWVRFVLEHYLKQSYDIIKNISNILKPGGILFVADLDYNCLNHYGLPQRLEKAFFGIMSRLEKHANFDPYVGRKLYSYLYDLKYHQIDVRIDAHHCIFGELEETDAFNWSKKVEIAARFSGYSFEEYEDGFDGFFAEFERSFTDPRRFTYTPVITCRGRKPV